MKTLIIIFLLLSSSISLAEESIAWYIDRAWNISDIKSIIDKVKLTEIKEYTELHSSYVIHVDKNKSSLHIKKIFYFPDINSVQNYGSDYISFNQGLDKVNILRLSSINSNGKVKNLLVEDLKINDANSYNTFTSTKNAIFVYPGLEAGGFAVYDVEIERDLRKQESDWYKEFYPQSFIPRLHFELKVSWDELFPLNFKSDSKHVECKESEDSVVCLGDNIPKIVQDSSVSWLDQLGVLRFGQYNYWDEVANTAFKRFAVSQATDQEDISEFVDELLDGIESEEEKITKIHNFVSQKIQYVSMSENGNSITPHYVKETFKKRAGDCKDKTALFYSMLKFANIKAFPVLVATDRLKLEKIEIPTLNIFDHMIICFEMTDNKMGCSDPTNSYADWRYISPYIQGKIAFPLVKEAKIFNLAKNKFRYQVSIETDLNFLSDGRQEEIQSRTYFGPYASLWRESLSAKSESEINQALNEDYKSKVSNKAELSVEVTGLRDVKDNVAVKTDAKFPEIINPKKNLHYIENETWLVSELESMKLGNKTYESNFAGLKIVSTGKWKIAPLWSLALLPGSLELNHKYGKMARSVKKLPDNLLEITTVIEIPQQRVTPEETDSFNELISIFKRESIITVYGELVKH